MKRKGDLFALFGFLLAVLLGLAACGSANTQSSTSVEDESYSEAATEAEDDWPESEDTDFEEEPVEETEPIPSTVISDGPVFLTRDGTSESMGLGSMLVFHLSHYNLETGEMMPFFHVDLQGKYRLTVDLSEENSLFHEQMFDSKLERIAVSWTETDSSNHVGWIDREGNVVDVSNLAHPATSEFSSTLPDDSMALFTKDDLFVFFDRNAGCYQYYDDATESIVDSFVPDDSLNGTQYLLGLDPQGHPTTKNMDCGGLVYNIFNNAGNDHTIGYARDYVEYSDGFVFFEIIGQYNIPYAISHFGPGLTEQYTYPDYAGGETVYVSYDSIIPITPPTDYTIVNLAYCNDMIVFSAYRGQERCLFKMPYTDRVAGEPELVCSLDSMDELFFWSDSDAPLFESMPMGYGENS